MTYATQVVLAAAYPGGRRSAPKSSRTHVVAFDEQGHEVRVLCRGVRLQSLECDLESPNRDLEPTCPTCRRRDPRRA